MKTLTKKGDTIVEVMIVLAILSFAITIAYASASRSLADSRQSEENSYAAELGQAQVEQIRSAVVSSTPDPTGHISNFVNESSSQTFCMNQGVAVLSSVASTMSPNPCTPVNGGATYTLIDTLTQTGSFSTGLPVYLFQVDITWLDTLGQGQDTVSVFYKVYPPQ